MPNLTWQNGPPLQEIPPGGTPQTVLKAMTATASTGTRVNAAATELAADIQAGKGAEAAMPIQLPKRINVQNANSAR